jgi:hypothetical protein
MEANAPKRLSETADDHERPMKRRNLPDQSALEDLEDLDDLCGHFTSSQRVGPLRSTIRAVLLPLIDRCYPNRLNPRYTNNNKDAFDDLWSQHPTLVNDIKVAAAAKKWADILELGKSLGEAVKALTR